jgi:hypothetical protein
VATPGRVRRSGAASGTGMVQQLPRVAPAESRRVEALLGFLMKLAAISPHAV